MKMNKWTIGLAAVGVVSLSSVAQAQEAAGAAGGDAASSVEINGYISSSYRMDGGEDIRANTGYANESARDRFNLDHINLRIGSAKSTGDWATGFLVETWIGDDAANLATDAVTDNVLAIKQAYIDMNTPIAGLELKLGVFDTIIGSEYHNVTENALFSRSWGFTVEPTTHTGLLATYKVSDAISVQLGVANTADAQINQGATDADNKTVLGGVSMKLPEGWWPWATADNAAAINVGLVSGKEGGTGTDVHNFYVGADLPLPAGFHLGLAFDLQKNNGGTSHLVADKQAQDNTVIGAYLSKDLDFISDKLSAVLRYEYADIPEYAGDAGGLNAAAGDKIQSITLGLSYDLWDNVTTRIEYRRDSGDYLISETQNSSDSIIANVVYQF